MKILIMSLGLVVAETDYNITELKGNIYKEEIGKVYLYSEEWKLMIMINITRTEDRIVVIQKVLTQVSHLCMTKCQENYEIKTISSRFSRLRKKESLLYNIMGKQRVKRGLLNVIGDASKILFGTLSDSDLNIINKEFDQLYNDNKVLNEAIKNNTKVIKMILDSSSQDYKFLENKLVADYDILNQMKAEINNNKKSLFIQQKLLIAETLIEEMNDDIDLAISSINLGKHGIINPQILTPRMLHETIDGFEKEFRTKYHIESDERNYQHIIDISEITTIIKNHHLVYIIKIPILDEKEMTIVRSLPIPERIINGQAMVFLPNHEYILQTKTEYVPIDKTDLEKCSNIEDYKICKRNQPNYLIYQTENCDADLIKMSNRNCLKSPLLLSDETFMKTETGYICIFVKETVIDIVCENNNYNGKKLGTYLITGNRCKLYTNEIKLDLNKPMKNISRYFEDKITIELDFEKDDLKLINDKLPKLPRFLNLDRIKEAKISMEDTEAMLDKLKTHERFKSWTEKSLTYLEYIGYASIVIIIFYIMFKTGIIQCILNLIRYCIGNCYTNRSFNNTGPTQFVATEKNLPGLNFELHSKPPRRKPASNF